MVLKADSIERLKNVVLQIRMGFQCNRKADDAVCNPVPLPLLLRIWRVSDAGGVLNQSLGITQAHTSRHQREAIHKSHPGLLAASQFARDQAAEGRHLPPRELMEWLIEFRT